MSGSRLALQGTALRMASLRGAALRGATLLLGAVLCGAWIAWSGKYGALALAVLALGATTLLVPWTWLLVALLVTVFTLVGPMQYAAGVNKAFWLPYLMGVLIGLRLLLESRRRDAGAGTAEGTPLDDGAAGLVRWGIGLGGLFLGTALLSSLLNRIGGMQALVAGKEYLFLLGLPLAFAFGHLRLEQLGGLWRWCTGWLVLQLPVVLWQRLFIAPRRGGESPWDAVVGLFAGHAAGGGGSGTMALVSLWACSVVLMAWRLGQAHGRWALLALSTATAACVLAEVKVAVIVLPLLALFVFGLHGPGRSARWMLLPVAAGLSGLLLWSHQAQFTSSRSAEGQSAAAYAQTIWQRGLDADMRADVHGQLSRIGALAFWKHRQAAQDVPGWLIGHGVGAVRRSGFSEAAMARLWRFEPGRNSAAILLWETGVLGLTSWIGAALCWTAAAWRMARSAQDAQQAGLLQAAAAGMALCVLALPYGADWFDSPHLATMGLLSLGMLLAAWRNSQSTGEAQT